MRKTFITTKKGSAAMMEVEIINGVAKNFVLLKGAKIPNRTTKSLKKHSSYKKRVEVESKYVKDEILLEDYKSKNPSFLSVLVLGRSANGWTTWKDEDNNYLSIYRAKNDTSNYDLYESFKEFEKNYSKQHFNDVNELRKEFEKEYPVESFKVMDLVDYAISPNNSNNLCRKLEFGKYKSIGSISGGYSKKFGIFQHNSGEWRNEEGRIEEEVTYWIGIRKELYNFIIEAPKFKTGENTLDKYPKLRGMGLFKAKILNMYYPEKYLKVYSKRVLLELIDILGYNKKDYVNFENEMLQLQFLDFLYELDSNFKNESLDIISDFLFDVFSNKGEFLMDDDVIEYENKFNETKQQIFMEDEKIDELLKILSRKKNIILQGSPGVGKTFIAKKIIELNDVKKENYEIVQFHQSYSYEDFVQGYRPNDDGNFELVNGLFYNLVKKAIDNSSEDFYMIIDEINRGNLSKIFGELLMLIESDKRGTGYSVSLSYSGSNEKFYIPNNLYIIGTMNTADRSLSLVDYALRRRFAFIDILPAFDSKKFNDYLVDYGLESGFIENLVIKLKSLNNRIAKELGNGFEIGHSYFTSPDLDDVINWYKEVINYEIKPQLEEYWFDKLEVAIEEYEKLKVD